MSGTRRSALRALLPLSCALLLVLPASAQQPPDSTATPEAPKGPDLPQVHGNFSMDAQLYNQDSAIGAVVPDELMGLNSWGNIQYTQGAFKAGIRFETYEPALVGYPAGQPYSGTGIGYRYASYSIDDLEITVGNFFEQFGQGMVFRSYEERYLGVDNAMDGVRVKFKPREGVYLKAFTGRQRFGFEDGYNNGVGIVRGADAEISLTECLPGAFPKWVEKGRNLVLGGSFVSKFQEDKDPQRELPENVGAWAGRLNYTTSHWNLYTEYAYKINDPNRSNQFIYKPGQALLMNATYSTKGLGISAGAHTFDNMVYQSDRAAQSLFNLNINFLPTLSKQHTYNLPATLYPYATQPNGEVAYQGEVFYKFKKGTPLGGKYGTKLAVNYSTAWSLDSTAMPDDTVRYQGYSTSFFQRGERQYFSDFNIELRKKLSADWELALTYINLVYDIEVVQGKAGKPVVYADMFILEGLHNFTDRNSVRFELQHLSTHQDKGNWMTGLAEFTFSPHWFIAVMDQFNYETFGDTFVKDGEEVETERTHYPIGSMGYIRGGNRFTVNYGRQRAGIFCVGGVCRQVPASNGLSVSITSTF
ncbi:MAG: hypothetical protein IPP26_15570 [Flavobacteriales bacterium]|nr:hypothetical protein [Flavobacteriales bacterium]